MNVAIIEFSNSHDECLYAQVAFLAQANHKVFLCVTPQVYERVKHFDLVHEFVVEGFDSMKLLKGSNRFKHFVKRLKQKEVQKVIFNSSSGKKVSRFLFAARKSFEFHGTIHNVDKLQTSKTQKYISKKLNNYFVINDYAKSIHGYSIESFYPIFFPPIATPQLQKNEGEIWVTIPGQLEFKRRGYSELFDGLKRAKIPQNVKFIFLGKSMHSHGNGAEVKQIIKDLGIEQHVVMFDGFIALDEFTAYIEQSDFILPLIHPKTSITDGYGEYKVSGAFNIAFGYKKPLLMDEYFKTNADFVDTSLFYNPEKIEDIFDLIQGELPLFYTAQQWKFETQQEKYLKHVGL